MQFVLLLATEFDRCNARPQHQSPSERCKILSKITIYLLNLLCEFIANSGYSKVLDLGSLFNRYPSYSQRPIYGGYAGYGNSNYYPGGYQSGGSVGGAGFYPNANGNFYPGSSGLGTNFLGWLENKQMIMEFQKSNKFY